MNNMTKQQLIDTKGGFSVWIGITIAAVVVFLVGVIDGFVHPKECE